MATRCDHSDWNTDAVTCSGSDDNFCGRVSWNRHFRKWKQL